LCFCSIFALTKLNYRQLPKIQSGCGQKLDKNTTFGNCSKSTAKVCTALFMLPKSVFSQNQAESPLFLQEGWANRAQIFFIATLVELGCVCFFCHEISFVSDLGAFRKFISLKKTRFLTKFPVFCFSCPMYLIFYDGTKDTHPHWVLIITEKISARKIKVSAPEGGKLLVTYGLCDLKNSQKKGTGDFESVTTFAVLVEIYQP
jgi:hypothetical protein